jgi:SAM-dependent methyltransferase
VFRRRRNLVERHSESWQPPPHESPTGGARNVLVVLRRFVDVQAGSIWRDLAPELRREHGTLVDVGCGAQPYRGLLPADAEYIGIDTVDAKEHFGYSLPDTRYFEGDVWPVADGSVDVVLATETLEHVPSPQLFMAEAFRCAKPGARLILTVPFSARWHFIPYDYWRFTPSSLALLLGNEGFADVAVYARGNAVTVAAYKVMALVLPLLFPQRSNSPTRIALRVLGLVLSPVVLVCAVVAQLSLRSAGGDDCLGYTVFARRPLS